MANGSADSYYWGVLKRELNINDGVGYENAASHFIALIPCGSIRQILAIFSGAEFQFQKDGIEVQEKKKKVVVLSSRPPQNVKLAIFTS